MLEILGLTYNDLPPVVPVMGTISGDGETIGRGNDNAIILPDPRRLISRKHLKFTIRDGNVYSVCNISSGNPVFINDEELASGMERPLRDHDRILIGGYVLQVAYATQGQKNAAEARLMPSPMPDNVGDGDFLAELLGSGVTGVKPAAPKPEEGKIPDPFLHGVSSEPDDIIQMLNECGIEPGSLDGKDDGLINGEGGGAAMDELLRDPLNAPANQQLRHDNSLDPLSIFDEAGDGGAFGDILQAGKGTASPPPPGMDLTHGSELNALFHLPSTGEPAPPAAKPGAEPRKPDIGNSPTEKVNNITDLGDIDDIIAGLSGDPAPTPKAAQADPLSTLLPDARLAGSVSPPPASDMLTSSGSPAESSAASDMNELFQAFIEGLGTNLPYREALDKAFMNRLGQALRYYTQGTIDLVAGRTAVKQAVRANVTVIAPERNNPLKFSPDANSALMGMFGKRPMPGFMEPAEAIRNAFIDLRAHQIGVISGMQAALNRVLERFNPAMLNDKIPPRGLAENIFSVAHKARLWGEYEHYFHALREKASDHFQEFFGEAFLEAYEKAIMTVQSGERTGKP